MSEAALLLIACLLPLAGFLALLARRGQRGGAALYFSAACMVAALCISAVALVRWVGKSSFQQPHYVDAKNIAWLPLGPVAAPAPAGRAAASHSTAFSAGLLVDSLTVTMFLTVTLVATLVQMFAMASLPRNMHYLRFFRMLNWSCFAVLGLLLSNSLLEIFAFWAMVSLGSYLLIVTFAERPLAGRAASRLLLASVLGDVCFLLGLALLVFHCGAAACTLYNRFGRPVLAAAMVHGHAAGAAGILHGHGFSAANGAGWQSWCGLAFVLAAVAKAGQFPLHGIWADAAECPSPGLALLLSVTQMAAAVDVLARLFPILTLDCRLVLAVVGCVTLAVGAALALVAVQAKRLVALVVVGQVGYLMLFLGTGGYVAAVFALVTHAFSTAALVLAAGAVITALDGQQDIRRMGGLWRKMPIATAVFLVAAFAICGTPVMGAEYTTQLGMAGAARDALALGSYGRLLYFVPAVVRVLTAFVLFRCWWLVFGGKPRDADLFERAAEGPMLTLPLILMGVLAVLSGHPFLEVQRLIQSGSPALARAAGLARAPTAVAHWQAAGRWAFAIGGVAAIALYFRGVALAERIRRLAGVNLVYLWLKNGLFFDDLFDGTVGAALFAAAAICAAFDRWVVNGLVTAAAAQGRRVAAGTAAADRFFGDSTVDALAAAVEKVGGAARAAPLAGARLYAMGMLSIALATALVVLAVLWLR